MRAAISVVCVSAMIACGAGDDTADSRSGGSAGSGGDQNSQAGGPNIGTPSDGGTSGVNEFDACATFRAQAQSEPVVLEMIVDISGSMTWPPGFQPSSPEETPPPGTTKWDYTKAALLSTLADLPGSTALGLLLYPNLADAPEGTNCIFNPQVVQIAKLGAQGSSVRKSFENALTSAKPFEGTPTHTAFSIGLGYAKRATAEGKKFILLITDGIPTYSKLVRTDTTGEEVITCSGDGINPVSSDPLLAEVAEASAAGIRTYVIGAPGSENARSLLSEMAEKGGTGFKGCSHAGPGYCHFDMTSPKSGDLGSALNDALGRVSASIAACQYRVPTPPSGQTLDQNRVNVVLSSSTADQVTLARASDPELCKEGWRYAEGGKVIELCGITCDRVRTDKRARLEILFGCETKIEAPK